MALTPFVRYERTDTQKDVPAGFARDGSNDRKAWTVGLDFKPIPQLALKVDWQDYSGRRAHGRLAVECRARVPLLIRG